MPKRRSTKEDQGSDEQAAGLPPDSLLIQYQRSALYRVVVANGFMAGLTGSGELHVVAWSEHPQYPTEAFARTFPDGTIREIPGTAGSRAVTQRELEVGLTIQLRQVQSLIDLLQTTLDLITGNRHEQPSTEPIK